MRRTSSRSCQRAFRGEVLNLTPKNRRAILHKTTCSVSVFKGSKNAREACLKVWKYSSQGMGRIKNYRSGIFHNGMGRRQMPVLAGREV